MGLDVLNEIVPPDVQALVLQVLLALTAAMPFLEKLAAKTATKADDRALEVVKKCLSLIPRVRLGK